MMTPTEARGALQMIRNDLRTPRLLYGDQPGPQGDMYRAVDKLVNFLEDALA